ncbi:MAG TPA: hypothetical protein VFE13_14910 [Caulobacteraceae bacterium]|jgi:hypothetical protein|nr:hypothetical protein [Caulobacteraceae bacterium]
MSEWLRLVLLVGLGGVGVTLLAMGLARLMAEDQRLLRAFRRALETRPDAAVIAHGTGRGVALGLAARRIVTVWDAGGWHKVYPLDELLGAELDLDGEVAARAMRGEPRRMLERPGGAVAEVRLRLLFDEPRHPDFELMLWPSKIARGAPTTPREAISEANRWIARVESLLRRTGGALTLTLAQAQAQAISRPSPEAQPAKLAAAQPETPPWDDLFDEADELAD